MAAEIDERQVWCEVGVGQCSGLLDIAGSNHIATAAAHGDAGNYEGLGPLEFDTRFYCHEGAQRVAEGRVTRVTGLIEDTDKQGQS